MRPEILRNPPFVRCKTNGVIYKANKFMLNDPRFEVIQETPSQPEVVQEVKKRPGRPKKNKDK